FSDGLSYQRRIRWALAAPYPIAAFADRYESVFQRHVEADKLVHGCLPFVAGPGVHREPVLQPIGGQPPFPRRSPVKVITPRDYSMFIISSMRVIAGRSANRSRQACSAGYSVQSKP